MILYELVHKISDFHVVSRINSCTVISQFPRYISFHFGQYTGTVHCESIPVRYISDSIPVRYILDSIPVRYISDSIPVWYISDRPVGYISDSIPVRYISVSVPVRYISDSVPVRYTVKVGTLY